MKKFTAIVIAVVLVLAMAPAVGAAGEASVDYIERGYAGGVVTGTPKVATATEWTNDDILGEVGKTTWYYIDGTGPTFLVPPPNDFIAVRGNVHLILKDGANATIPYALSGASDPNSSLMSTAARRTRARSRSTPRVGLTL